MNRNLARNIGPLIAASLIIALATYVINSWLFSTQPYLISRPYLTSTDMVFLEGLAYVLVGILLFLGSGGISRASQGGAVLASTAKVFDEDVVGPSEIFRRDAWKPKGFTRTALILIMAGLMLLIIYFISL